LPCKAIEISEQRGNSPENRFLKEARKVGVSGKRLNFEDAQPPLPGRTEARDGEIPGGKALLPFVSSAPAERPK
jgi:hypothetical protein